MLRSVGALIFGALADRYGCRWPMMATLSLLVVLELGSGFCQNLSQFLVTRSLYGIVMGGEKASRNKQLNPSEIRLADWF